MQDGILKSEKSGANLITDEKFNDFKLHVEFRIPKGSNSGVYLRGRYEVQVADGLGLGPAVDQLGAVYGFLGPREMVAEARGRVAVVRRHTDRPHGHPGCQRQAGHHPPGNPGRHRPGLRQPRGRTWPLYVQGDHGAVEYQNIVITPAR